FFSKFLVWYLTKSQTTNKDLVERLTKLGSNVALARKLMRAGRQIEFARNIQKSRTIKDPIVAYTVIGKNVGLALWLLFDTLSWMQSVGVTKFTKPQIENISRRGNHFWLLALFFSLSGSLHKLRINLIKTDLETRILRAAAKDGKGDESAEKNLKVLKKERFNLTLATVQDSLDVLIPSSLLNYINVEPGIVYLAGSITSILGG
ncbi:Peroxisomal membrane protein PMP27, partial [Quaeritorhiza haematococci]